MKTFLQLFAAMLLGIVVSVVGLQIYDHATKQSVDGSGIEMLMDSIASAKIADYTNPVFSNTEELLSFRDFYVDDKQLDDVFIQLPEKVIQNVAGVCISKNGCVSKRELVLEYLDNQDVYNNLPNVKASDNPAQPVDTNATDLGNRRDNNNIISTSYRYRTDTVNGKPIKIRVMTEEKIE